MTAISVWIKLYMSKDDQNPSVFKIKDFTGDVDDLKEKIKEKEQLDFPASRLDVYPQGTDVSDLEGISEIDAWDSVPLSTSGKDPLIVIPNEQRLRQLNKEMQQLHLLKAVAEEVNKGRKSRLNCWDRESARTTGSQRNSNFRKKVISYYRRESSSRKSVKCQILDEYVSHAVAQDTIVAAHIWKASTRGRGLEEFGLCEEDINNARNGLFLTKGIEDAFDSQRVCFLYNTLNNELCLWVADARILSETIEKTNPPRKFADVHQKPLCCPDERQMPFRRLLSWHARLTLELRKQSIQVSNYTSEYDLSPGRDSATLDPISRAIDEMVEPGEDASVSSR